MIGRAHTRFQGRSANDLRRSIMDGTTRAVTNGSVGISEIGVGPLVRQTLRGLSTTPRTMGLGRTARSFFDRIFHSE
jgi:hypothetical protein